MRARVFVTTAVVGVLAAQAGMSASAESSTPPTLAAHVRDAAARHQVSEHLILAIIKVESDFNPRAVSPRGARGLMQIMPATGREFGTRDLLDPRQNISAGARYLRELLDRFSGDLPLALAAYNAGEQAVVRYGGVPPFPETRAFVTRVLGLVGDGLSIPISQSTDQTPDVTYHPRTVLAELASGAPKERVFDVLATAWTGLKGKLVKTEGLRIRVSRRPAGRPLVEAGDVTLLDAGGTPSLHWLLFEDHRLLAVGRVEDWPRAVARYALDVDYVPGARIP
jgi:hypothetical protein